MDREELEEYYKTVELDQFHAHEALDRTFLVSEMFDGYVLDHPFIFKNEKLMKEAEEISFAMFNLYQNISNESLDKYDH